MPFFIDSSLQFWANSLILSLLCCEEVLASEIFLCRYLLKDKRSFLLQVLQLLPLFFPFVVHVCHWVRVLASLLLQHLELLKLLSSSHFSIQECIVALCSSWCFV
jgi:hypothetical protein